VTDVLSAVSAGTATTTSTDDDGNTVVSGGVYAGDSAVRALSQDLIEAFTRPVDGRSPASALGISVDRDGAITIDESVLAASLAADPEGTQAFATALSARVAQVGTTYSDPISGLITAKISGQQTLSADLEARISEWDTRIADRKASLLTKFNAMETTLATLKTTSSWLDTQLAGLMTNYSGSKS
jgi:flagellar hook-associated protein 2